MIAKVDDSFKVFACPWCSAVNGTAHGSILEEGFIGRMVADTGVQDTCNHDTQVGTYSGLGLVSGC